jgi:hypothetical protein
MTRILFPASNTFILLMVIFTVNLSSCERITDDPMNLGHEYFNLNEGHFNIYEVDSTVYDDFLGRVFQYKYHVKEVNKNLFTASNGLTSMRIERFIRANGQSAWQIKNVWTATLTPSQALKNEENITYVKLAFPLRKNKTWNGNSYNSGQQQDYKITDLHEPFSQNGLSFDSTLTVLQNEFRTLIGDQYQSEIYARGIGMINKISIALDKEIDGTIIRGVEYSYKLLETGTEK